MPKQAPALPTLARKKHDDEMITEVREYTVITPIFGGGVDAGKPDEVTPIRVPTIRGHLRFWWRATRGAACKTIRELHKQEAEIWGSTEQPSKVNITVEVTQAGTPFQHKPPIQNRGQIIPNIGHIKSNYAYAAFPMSKEEIFEPPYNHRFKLTLRYPKSLQTDIKAALWAWGCFGWIGSRGRRGFGAISLQTINQQEAPKYPDDPRKLEEKLRQEMDTHTQSTTTQLFPTLRKDCRIRAFGKSNQAGEVWKNLLDRYKKFRQSRTSGNIYGRSLWPEADAIRSLTGRMNNRYKIPEVKHQGRAIIKFPRAQFGLPIIFQFKDKGDPSEAELYPPSLHEGKKIDRMASPLLLRPFETEKGFIGIVLILESSFPFSEQLQLKKTNCQDKLSAKPTNAEANDIKPLNGKKDALQAFFDKLP